MLQPWHAIGIGGGRKAARRANGAHGLRACRWVPRETQRVGSRRRIYSNPLIPRASAAVNRALGVRSCGKRAVPVTARLYRATQLAWVRVARALP
eukprot:6056062-Prymnesium_polylepis.1